MGGSVTLIVLSCVVGLVGGGAAWAMLPHVNDAISTVPPFLLSEVLLPTIRATYILSCCAISIGVPAGGTYLGWRSMQ